jgi:predicted enzyme related to lactoylglutathione lyase
MSSRPVHFDMTAEDPERMTTFYSKVFGWTFQKWDGPMAYWMATTGEGESGINGGISQRDPGKPAQTVNTIAVDSIDASMAAITAAGGEITMDKHEIPGVGTFAQALDTEGNQIGIIQFAQAPA